MVAAAYADVGDRAPEPDCLRLPPPREMVRDTVTSAPWPNNIIVDRQLHPPLADQREPCHSVAPVSPARPSVVVACRHHEPASKHLVCSERPGQNAGLPSPAEESTRFDVLGSPRTGNGSRPGARSRWTLLLLSQRHTWPPVLAVSTFPVAVAAASLISAVGKRQRDPVPRHWLDGPRSLSFPGVRDASFRWRQCTRVDRPFSTTVRAEVSDEPRPEGSQGAQRQRTDESPRAKLGRPATSQ